MTNKQTIDEIIKAPARETWQYGVKTAWYTLEQVNAAMAAKDAEIEHLTRECADLREDYANLKDAMRDDGDVYRAEIDALKQRLADSMRDLQALKADHAPGEWVEWKGGDCPIADGVEFQIKFRCEPDRAYIPPSDATSWIWTHGYCGGDIIAYRIIP